MNNFLLQKFLFACVVFLPCSVLAQEVYFFSEGTTATYYDQGVVDKSNLGLSTFEFTYPPGYPQYNDKVPCSSPAYKGATALKFNYRSSDQGNWKVSIYRSGWSSADISTLDSISFYLYSDTNFPNSALPLIGIRAASKSGSGDGNSKLYKLSDYNSTIETGKWNRIKFPLSAIVNDGNNSALNFTVTKGIIFSQSETNNASRLIFIDELTAYKSITEVPAVSDFEVQGYDSHAELNWTQPAAGIAYRIYASFDGGQTYILRTETSDNYYLDFVPESEKNKTVFYRIVSVVQNRESTPNEKSVAIRDFSDEELLDMVQRYTFRYFWEGAHQASGMARERSNSGANTVASGGTGMGLMAMIVAHEREFEPREEIKDRILKILNFLETCDRHHGAWSHWYDGDSGHTKPFGDKDDGGDLVETSYVAEALIALRNYFSGTDQKSVQIREKADLLWKGIDWDWYRQGGQNVLYWHWSPNYAFQKNMKVSGWNECLSTYVMAASSPTHSIPKIVYEQGWARNGNMVNKRTYYDYQINLSPNWGGPLFWLHYSFLGINPHGLNDQYADYWQENVNTVKIHHEYAVRNPLNFKNYSDKCWGLTASDDPNGYTAHKPMDNDNGTISPTAALASMPYTPEESIKSLKYFYRERGAEVFGLYGTYDAFNEQLNWVKKAYLAIDQGPIAVMIENYRTGLLWNNFMKDVDVKAGLDKLGFQYETSTGIVGLEKNVGLKAYPNPANDKVFVNIQSLNRNIPAKLEIYSIDGRRLVQKEINDFGSELLLNSAGWKNGLYLIRVENGNKQFQTKILIQK